MRFVSLLITTLLLATTVFAQQASSTTSSPAQSQSTPAAKDQPTVDVVEVKRNPPPPAHPITQEQVHEIMRLTHADDLAHENLLDMFAVLRRSLPPYFPQDVFVDILKQSEKIDFEPIEKPTYQNLISTEDAAQIIAFYKTPAGQHLIAAMPAIAREMRSGGASEGMKVAQQVVKEHSDEIKAAAAKYSQQHPDAPTITAPN